MPSWDIMTKKNMCNNIKYTPKRLTAVLFTECNVRVKTKISLIFPIIKSYVYCGKKFQYFIKPRVQPIILFLKKNFILIADGLI